MQVPVRLGDLEGTSRDSAPTPDVMPREMLPGMLKELPWRWSVLPPTSCSSERKCLVRGLSLFRNPSLALEYAAGPGCKTYPECGTSRESGGPETRLFRIFQIRYSSAWHVKSESAPVLFRN